MTSQIQGAADGPKESVSAAYFNNSTAPRVHTDAVIFNSIQSSHPGIPITVVPEYSGSLRAYAASGHASIEEVFSTDHADRSGSGPAPFPDSMKRTVFLPPARRTGDGDGVVADEALFESFLYKWQGFVFLVYYVNGRDGTLAFPEVRNQYILGDEAGARTLLAAIGRFDYVLHDEIWVFNQGYWQKNNELYASISKARWEDVILDQDMKDELIETVQRFFDSQEQYERLRVPWKRGVIFYGPPGNGKTISIKATMNMLYRREAPVPTLYVKSLVGTFPSEYSIEEIFRKARQQAPCYLVFEDLDSLVTDDLRSFFLNALDGLAENQGVFMIGSTNHLERLDPGIANRPSRFDRKYLFPNPDLDQRVQYCHFWQGKLKGIDDIEFPDKICTAAAEITDGFSFAFIQEAFVSSLLEIAREGKKHGAASGEVDALRDDWELLDLEARTCREKGLDDFILWRKLKFQIELLRKELGKED